MEALGGLTVIFGLLIIFVAILWVFMPFAIFGTKDKLETLILETRKNTAAVQALHETMKVLP